MDMGITHVIRGDDHLNNTPRQVNIFNAFNAALPVFAHVPMIVGADGQRLSKRHGAVSVLEYRDQGFLPEAMRNYLLRLGWSHGDDEIISTDQAIDWFNLENIGKSAARFDMTKLTSLNGTYIREADNGYLADLVMNRLQAEQPGKLAKEARDRLFKGMNGLKERAKTISELSENAIFYALQRPIEKTEKAATQLEGDGADLLREIRSVLSSTDTWTDEALMATAREFAEAGGRKLGAVAQPIRAALTGNTVSPSVFEIMDVLGREETLGRIDDALTGP